MAKQPRILAGQTAAITGAARGIGKATAQALVRQGMKVAIGDVDLAAAQQTAAELGREHDRGPARRHRSRFVRRLPRPRRRAARARRRARQQRGDHADRAIRRRGRPHGEAHGGHQHPRRHPRHEAGARSDGAPRSRAHREHLLAGRQVRGAGRRDLLGHQARRRGPQRGRARRVAADGRPCRSELCDAVRRQHRARLGVSARRAG